MHKFVGDITGVLHVGPNQTVIGQFADNGEFEINTYVYQDGVLHLPKSFLCRNIRMVNRWVRVLIVAIIVFQVYS